MTGEFESSGRDDRQGDRWRRAPRTVAHASVGPTIDRDVVALFLLGMLAAIVCATTSGALQLMTAVVALATPSMGRALMHEPARCSVDPGAPGRG